MVPSPVLAGLPAGLSLADLGNWLLAHPDEIAPLASAGPPGTMETFEAAVDAALAARPRTVVEPWRSDPAALAHHLTGGSYTLWSHIRLLSAKFVEAIEGTDVRQLWNLPSQLGKTSLLMRCVIWALDRDPSIRIMYVSYDADKAVREAGEALDFAREHREFLRFDLRPDIQARGRWNTRQGGGLYATGIGGAIVGWPASAVLGDDLLKGWVEAHSARTREITWNVYKSQMRLRLQSETDPVILAGTRWHCLSQGTGILTPMGIVPVESIKPGAEVITSQGVQPVLGAASRLHKGNVVSVRTFGFPLPLRVTPEHQILTEDGWRQASEVRPGDWLVMPVPQGETTPAELRALIPPAPGPRSKMVGPPAGLSGANFPVSKAVMVDMLERGMTYQEISTAAGCKSRSSAMRWAAFYGLRPPAGNVLKGDPVSDPDFWRIVGWWLAEGTTTYGRDHLGSSRSAVVRWTLGWSESPEADDIIDVLKRYGLTFRQRPIRNGVNMNFHSERESSAIDVKGSCWQLAVLLRQFGSGAYNKFLPEWAIRLPVPMARQLVAGYLAGDGCVMNNGDKLDGLARICSVSLPLLCGVQRLLSRLGVASSIMATLRAYEIRFRVVDAPWLGIETRPRKTRRHHSLRLDAERMLVKVKTVTTEPYDGSVYDLKTPTHDFVAHAVVVHNSDDVTGMALAEQGLDVQKWTLIRLPHIAESPDMTNEIPEMRLPDPLGRAPGEPLEKFSLAEIQARERTLGAYLASGLEYQRPAPEEGGELKRAWWKWETSLPPSYDDAASSWDTALRDKDTSDYVVGQVWGRTGADFWMAEQVRGHFGLLMTKLAVALLSIRHPYVNRHYVENTGAGPEVMEELRAGSRDLVVTDEQAGALGMTEAERAAVQALVRAGVPGIIPVNPKGSKQIRARAVSGILEAGNCHLLAGDAGALHLVEECAAFDQGTFDDCVDAFSQAMSKLRRSGATVQASSGQVTGARASATPPQSSRRSSVSTLGGPPALGRFARGPR